MKTVQAFVSHTSDVARFPADRSFVQAALDGIGRAGLAPVDMRYFAAGAESPAGYCRRRVRECEIYIAVVGLRYGTYVPGEQVSYTEMEFQAAGAAGLPRLIFLLDEATCPPALADSDRAPVKEFRQRLANAGLIVRTFSSGHELELEVFHALSLQMKKSAPQQISNIPSRNIDFTGRDEVIERLHHGLSSDGTAVITTQALYGLGGVGKTQIALEYAHRHKENYDLRWWVPAEHAQRITLSLAELALQLGLPRTDNPAHDALAALERLRRETDYRWLLVFDNAGDPADVMPFLPTGSGHIIVTSRDHTWTRQTESIQLDIFFRAESVEHLKRHVPGLDRRDAETISAAVGDLPLAIEQAGAWLGETGMPASIYIERLLEHTPNALALSNSLGYATSVAAIWDLSLRRLHERSSAAAHLLKIISFCSPDEISLKFLYGDEMNAVLLPYDARLDDKSKLGSVISEITRLALARLDLSREMLQIHRLVQAVIRSRMTDNEQRRVKHEVHSILSASRPLEGETDDPANWPTYALIFPHLISSDADSCDDSRARQLLLDWVRYQWKLGEYQSALDLADRLRDLWTEQLGPNDQQTLQLSFQMANILREMGRFGDAHDLDKSTLDRQQTTLGPHHIDSLRTIGSVGADLTALGDLQQAATSFRAAYENLLRKFGTSHPRTLMAARNLAEALNRAGDPLAAFRLEQETLENCQQVLGPDHPATIEVTAELGRFAREKGAISESIGLLDVAYQDLRRVLGDDFAETLRTGKSLAVSLRKAGKTEEAGVLTAEIYDRSLRRYGPTAIDTLSCRLNQASDYLAKGQTDQAEQVVEQVRDNYVHTVGADHPFTLIADNNLSWCLRARGKTGQAGVLNQRTLQAMRIRLGEDHPYTIASMLNLAGCLADTRELRGAHALESAAVTAFTEKLGPMHPDTLLARANHAVTTRAMGRRRQARRLQADALADFEQSLGPRHPRAILLQQWRRDGIDLEAHPI